MLAAGVQLAPHNLPFLWTPPKSGEPNDFIIHAFLYLRIHLSLPSLNYHEISPWQNQSKMAIRLETPHLRSSTGEYGWMAAGTSFTTVRFSPLHNNKV